MLKTWLSPCSCSISMKWFRGDNELVIVEVTFVMSLLGFRGLCKTLVCLGVQTETAPFSISPAITQQISG